jgi:hypothetical protein
VQLDDQVSQEPHAQRIETAKGFIEHDELGLVDHGSDEADLLLHAFRKLLAALARDGFEAHPLEPVFRTATGLAALDAFEPREVSE